MMRLIGIFALLLTLPQPAIAGGQRFAVHNDGVVFGPGVTRDPAVDGVPYFSEFLNNAVGGAESVGDFTGDFGERLGHPRILSVADLLAIFAEVPVSSVSYNYVAIGALFGDGPAAGGGAGLPRSWARLSDSNVHGLVRFSGPAPLPVGPDDTLALSGVGTWVGPVLGGGGTLVLDGLKGVPLSIKRKLSSRKLGGGVLDLGPKLRVSGFDRLVVKEIVSYEELAQGSGFEEVGYSIDWAAPHTFGPEIFFLAGLSAVEDRESVHGALASFSGATVFQGFSDVAFGTETFLANKLQDYLDDRHEGEAEASGTGEEPDSPWRAFARAVGTRSDRADQLWVNYGAFGGLDRRFGERGLAGVFAGYRRTSASHLDVYGSDFRSNDPSAGFYGSWGCDCGIRLAGSAWYTHRDYSGGRRVAMPSGFATTAAFDTDAHQLTSFARASYEWRPSSGSHFVVAPRFAVQYSRLSVNGYEESGAGALDLTVGSQVPESLRTALGLRVAWQLSAGSVRLRPQLRGDWYHELFDGTSVPVGVASGYFSDFHVPTSVPERDFGKLGVGVVAAFARCACVEVGLGFDTLVSGQGLDAFDTTLHVGVRF